MMPFTVRSQAFAAGFIGLTLLPGAWTFASAPVSGLGMDVFAGATQRRYETRFDDSFPMRDALRQAWTAVKYATFGEVAEGALVGHDGVLFTAEEFLSPAAHRDFTLALRTADQRIAAAGGELIPVIVPDKARMMPRAVPRARSKRFEQRYDQLLQMIWDTGLRTADLRAALSEPASYMVSDTHWSPEGAQSVAVAIGQLLAGDLDTKSNFETTRTGTRDFGGDLLVFVDTGVWRSWVGPSFEAITTYETESPSASGLGLFDDVPTPIALVGTSFSARKDFHFTGFLKSTLRADVLSYALEGRGPFVPMDRFLESDALTDAAPKFVIWEVPERYLDTWSQDQ